MDVFRGEIDIADWENSCEIEVATDGNFQVIKVLILPFNDRGKMKKEERFETVTKTMRERGVTFRRVESRRGVFVNILTLKADDPVNFLKYAFQHPVLLKKPAKVMFSKN